MSLVNPVNVAPVAGLPPEAAHVSIARDLIRLMDVRKVYGAGEAAVVALDRIDLTIDSGEFVAVLGPSGSGKSTAMNILGCLDLPTSGHYLLEGVDVAALREPRPCGREPRRGAPAGPRGRARLLRGRRHRGGQTEAASPLVRHSAQRERRWSS